MLNQMHIDLWLSQKPTFHAIFKRDKDALYQYTQKAEALLQQLPQKLKRNEQESYLAKQILVSCRQARQFFIQHHHEEIYAELTANFTLNLRLSELVYSAAERFPGLVPTHKQIEDEQKHIQAHKEGLEIDQGIFFQGLMRSKKISAHIGNAMRLPCPRAVSMLEQLKKNPIMELGTVRYERHSNAAYLIFNNPHNLNAEDNRFVEDMETAVDLALLDDQVNVCVLRGGEVSHPRYSGKRVFCSGINLKDLHAGKISFINFLLTRELGYINKIMHGLVVSHPNQFISSETIQKPWIAVVDSFAIGGGAQVLLVCDKIIAANDAYLCLPAAQEGIIPGAANLRLPRIGGNRLSRQIILSGKKIFANSLEAQYLFDEVVDNEQIDTSITKSVHALSQPAVIENRKLLNFSEEPLDRFYEYIAEFAYIQASRLYSSDVLYKISRWTRNDMHIAET